jgi:glutamate-1-semialdehyde aminotransferase
MSGNPIVMAAGLATLNKLKNNEKNIIIYWNIW